MESKIKICQNSDLAKNILSNHGGNILSYEKDLYDSIINTDNADDFNFQKLKKHLSFLAGLIFP